MTNTDSRPFRTVAVDGDGNLVVIVAAGDEFSDVVTDHADAAPARWHDPEVRTVPTSTLTVL